MHALAMSPEHGGHLGQVQGAGCVLAQGLSAIQRIDSTTLKQICAGCGAVHAIPIKQASIKARKGPYGLSPGDTLELEIDGKLETITFTAREIAAEAMTLATAAATAAAAQLDTASVDADRDALRIISRSTGFGVSSIRVTGGTAKDKLGLDDREHRPIRLGVTKGSGAAQRTAPNTIDLPHCPECGAKEMPHPHLGSSPG
jgi:hypothetical protein